MSAIDSASTLSAISKLESDLAKLKIALGVPGVTVPKSRKSAPKADGEKKAPNVWIRFTQQVDAALKAASISTGAAPVAKQFASALKDMKPYAEWTDETIVAAWATWEKPEQSKMDAEKAKRKESESEGGAESETKERKKRAPMTEEAKAAMKLKRAATVAAKKAGGGGGGAELPASQASSEDEEEAEEAIPAPPAAAPPAAPPTPAKSFSKKIVGAKEAVTYTIEQLKDFDAVTIEGAEYGRNVRGDLVDGDGNFIGTWNAKTSVIQRGVARPADWEAIMGSD